MRVGTSTTRRAAKRCVGVLVAAGVIGCSVVPTRVHASNAPPNGCPNGFQYLSVSDLTAMGYHVPALVDSPANGGNGDGYICARALGERTTSWGGQLYLFADNQLPASTVAP